jgi:hypothetical protein
MGHRIVEAATSQRISGSLLGDEKGGRSEDADPFDLLAKVGTEVAEIPGQENVGFGLDGSNKDREVLLRKPKRRRKPAGSTRSQQNAKVFRQGFEGLPLRRLGKIPLGLGHGIGGGHQRDLREGPQVEETR